MKGGFNSGYTSSYRQSESGFRSHAHVCKPVAGQVGVERSGWRGIDGHLRRAGVYGGPQLRQQGAPPSPCVMTMAENGGLGV